MKLKFSQQLSPLLLLTLLAPDKALTDVNMQTGSFHINVDDYKNPVLRRTYNSRSLHSGFFGFGWCSTYEKSISVEPNTITLFDCNIDNPITYKLSPLESKYFSTQNTKDYFQIKDRNYLRFKDNKLIESYDWRGQLNVLWHGSGTFTELTYQASGRPARVRRGGQELIFKWDQFNRITQISNTLEKQISYQYQDENLISASISAQQKQLYTYDLFSNLTRILFPDQSYEDIQYDDAKDLVLAYKSQNNCWNRYKYDWSHRESQMYQASYIAKTCGTRTQYGKIEFWFSKINLMAVLDKFKITPFQTRVPSSTKEGLK